MGGGAREENYFGGGKGPVGEEMRSGRLTGERANTNETRDT